MHNLPSVGELASFLVPGMICSLLSGSKVQLSSCWLLPRYKCHYHTFRDILLCRSLLWFIGFTAEQGYWLMWVILIKLSSVGWASIPGSPAAVHLSLNTENKLCSNELPFLGTQFVQLGSPGPACLPLAWRNFWCLHSWLHPCQLLRLHVSCRLSQWPPYALSRPLMKCETVLSYERIDLDFAFGSAGRRDDLGLEGDGASGALLLQEQLSRGLSNRLELQPSLSWTPCFLEKVIDHSHMPAVRPRRIPDDLFNADTNGHWANVSKEIHVDEATLSTVFLDQGLSRVFVRPQ